MKKIIILLIIIFSAELGSVSAAEHSYASVAGLASFPGSPGKPGISLSLTSQLENGTVMPAISCSILAENTYYLAAAVSAAREGTLDGMQTGFFTAAGTLIPLGPFSGRAGISISKINHRSFDCLAVGFSAKAAWTAGKLMIGAHADFRAETANQTRNLVALSENYYRILSGLSISYNGLMVCFDTDYININAGVSYLLRQGGKE